MAAMAWSGSDNFHFSAGGYPGIYQSGADGCQSQDEEQRYGYAGR